MTRELTAKEQKVCDLVILGKTHKEIGAELCIGHRTVECHVRSIYEKLQVRNAVQLTRKMLLGANPCPSWDKRVCKLRSPAP